MMASFRQFCQQPENKPMLEKAQRQERRKMLKHEVKANAYDFREMVLQADATSQANILPFMDNKVLRRFIQTFTNDENKDFAKWAQNPLVLEMLHKAKEMMDQGRMSEDEMFEYLNRMLRDPRTEGHDAYMKKVERKAHLETKDLVSALNEQVQLRNTGNKNYISKNYAEAKENYEKGLGIMNLVKAHSPYDQMEIDNNKTACLMNLAAVCMAMEDYGEAIGHLEKVEEMEPANVKMLLRRARAHRARGDFKEAMADLKKVKKLDSASQEADYEMEQTTVAAHHKRAQDRELAAAMMGQKVTDEIRFKDMGWNF